MTTRAILIFICNDFGIAWIKLKEIVKHLGLGFVVTIIRKYANWSIKLWTLKMSLAPKFWDGWRKFVKACINFLSATSKRAEASNYLDQCMYDK